MIDVGVCGDNHLTGGQRKVELPDEVDNLVDGLLETHVDQDPVRAIVEEIDIASEPLTGLVIHFDNVREERLALEHGALPWLQDDLSGGNSAGRRSLNAKGL
jgi:hypothetical protein